MNGEWFKDSGGEVILFQGTIPALSGADKEHKSRERPLKQSAQYYYHYQNQHCSV
jgi:hypothetical protein